MSSSSHRIRRLSWVLSTGSLSEAFDLRQSLRDRWQELLLLACEKAFDDAVRGEEIIHVSQLVVSLKIAPGDELMKVLPVLIQQQLQEQLPTLISNQFLAAVGAGVTTVQTQWEILLHYLQTGLVPWQAADTTATKTTTELQATCQQQRLLLLNHLANKPETTAFYFRLLQLLSAEMAMDCINVLAVRFSPSWRTVVTTLIEFIFYPTQIYLSRHIQGQLVAAIMAASGNQALLPADFSEILTNCLMQTGVDRDAFISLLPVSAKILFQAATPNPDTTTIVFRASEVPVSSLEQIRSEQSSLAPDASNLWESSIDRSPQELEFLHNNLNSDAGGFSPDNRERSSNILSSDTDGFFADGREGSSPGSRFSEDTPRVISTSDEFPLLVNYAGLILLHPFINAFFEATGVKETHSPQIANNQLARAAALLHWLATGAAELHEYELSFIKILLGLSPTTALSVGSGLVLETDRTEAETVLQSVLNYWTVLKSTSMYGLRSSFLQRSGLLHKTENGWRLQIEQQSFDMLLEHLPWNISVIKLSWMQDPLYTEWQTF
jgi:Contractile injection system tape measure protein